MKNFMFLLLIPLILSGCGTEAVWVIPSSGGYDYSGYGGLHPSMTQGMYLQPGMCDDIRTGGQISCQFLQYNPRYECCGIIENKYAGTSNMLQSTNTSAVVYSQPSKYPPNMWEKKDGGRKAVEEHYDGPTEKDYIKDPKWVNTIPEGCRSSNVGHNIYCLERQLPVLKKHQAECKINVSMCPPNFDFEKAAWYDRHLIEELKQVQAKWK